MTAVMSPPAEVDLLLPVGVAGGLRCVTWCGRSMVPFAFRQPVCVASNGRSMIRALAMSRNGDQRCGDCNCDPDPAERWHGFLSLVQLARVNVA